MVGKLKKTIALLLSIVMLIAILMPLIIQIAEADSYYDAIIDKAIDRVVREKEEGNSFYYDLMKEYRNYINKDMLKYLYENKLTSAEKAEIESRFGNVMEELDNITRADILKIRKKINLAIAEVEGIPPENGGSEIPDPDEDEQNGSEVETDFKDISSLWQEAQDAINFMAKRGILQGKSEGIFAPNDPITRAEFAKTAVMLLRLEDDTSIDNKNFKDVDKNEWYHEYIQIAFKHGIVEGKSSETFAPNHRITRQEMAVMTARAIKLTDKAEILPPLQVKEIIQKYADSTQVADWAETEMALIIKNKIIQGREGNKLAPEDNATRAETVVILKRFYDFLDK